MAGRCGRGSDCVWCWRDQEQAARQGMPVPLRYRVHRRVVDESGDRVGLCLRHLAEWRNRRPRGGTR